jgi:hypothetical protein
MENIPHNEKPKSVNPPRLQNEHRTSVKKRVNLLFLGFMLGGLPTLILFVLYSVPFAESCANAAVVGAVFGILAAVFGEKMLKILAAIIKSGWT